MDYTQLHTQQAKLSPIPVKRLTISMPAYVYDRLMQLPKGTVSQFVTEGIQEKFTYPALMAKETQKKKQRSTQALNNLKELMQKEPLPKIPWPEMKKLMRKGLA